MAENEEKVKKPIYKKWWFWVIVVIIVIAIASSGSSDNTSNTSKTTLTSGDTSTGGDNNTQNNTTTETKTSYNVGEIYEDSNVAIKYVSLDDNFTGYSKYADVKSGYKIIKAEFEFENVGSSDFLASAYDFNCYADGYDCEDFWSTDDSGFSSTLSAGRKTKGSVYFQVPINAKEITLEYELNVWTSDKVTFVVK